MYASMFLSVYLQMHIKLKTEKKEFKMQISTDKVSTNTKKKTFNLNTAKSPPLNDTVNTLTV